MYSESGLFLNAFAASPSFVIQPTNTSITEFDELLLFCNASGQPRPAIAWRRKDKETVFLPGEYLRLPNVTRDDAGLYECTAQNRLGSVSAIFGLKVLCK